MATVPSNILEPFLAAADAVAVVRPDVDAGLARELMAGAAEMLHNGLVLDHLDEHDHRVVVAALAEDLTDVDPGAAVRARATTVADDDPTLHEPAVARAAYLVTVQVLGL